MENKLYEVTTRIKRHTSPLYEIDVVRRGTFKKETGSTLVFDGFRVRKSNVIKMVEVQQPTALERKVK